jgi:hypothetical protein
LYSIAASDYTLQRTRRSPLIVRYQLYNGPAYLCGADAALAEQSAMMRDFFGVKHGACATVQRAMCNHLHHTP